MNTTTPRIVPVPRAPRLRSPLPRLLAFALVALVAIGATGCVSRYGPGGATPGLFYSNVAYPNAVNPNMDFRIVFDRDDIEILGPVEAESSSKWWFFLFSKGDSGYGTLMNEVRRAGGDGVMNLTIDTQYNNVFLFYAKVTTRLTGTAYRYKRDRNGGSGGGVMLDDVNEDDAALDPPAVGPAAVSRERAPLREGQ